MLRVLAVAVCGLALTSCAGAPPIDKVAAEVEAAGACKSLPAGVTCDCVVSTAHAAIPATKAPRSNDDTGSRLGRGTVGAADPRVAIAIDNARQSCTAGKAVGG